MPNGRLNCQELHRPQGEHSKCVSSTVLQLRRRWLRLPCCHYRQALTPFAAKNAETMYVVTCAWKSKRKAALTDASKDKSSGKKDVTSAVMKGVKSRDLNCEYRVFSSRLVDSHSLV
jgi:hypothetical protein